MRQVENFTVFFRQLRGHSVDHQRKLVAKVLQALGGKVVAEYVAGETGSGDRDEWIKRTRQHEGAIVAGLFVIPEPRSECSRPSADYAAALMALVQGCAVVVDAETGITSRDGAKWRALVELHAGKTAAGRQMTRKRAKKMATKRWEGKPLTATEKWTAPNMKRERERWAQHWRDPKYRTGQDALDALPADLRAEFRTARRMYDIFGPRDPSGGKGGRPRKPKASKR